MSTFVDHGHFVLENNTLQLEFSRETGALVRLVAVKSGWKILDRPHLGLSFRLLLPLSEGRRNNPVFGEKQKITSMEVAPDGRCAVFVWDGVASEYGGQHDIKLTLEVKLTERQVVYSLAIENYSEYIVENVYCPYLGDVAHPGDEEWFKTFLWNYASAQEWNLWPT